MNDGAGRRIWISLPLCDTWALLFKRAIGVKQFKHESLGSLAQTEIRNLRAPYIAGFTIQTVEMVIE